MSFVLTQIPQFLLFVFPADGLFLFSFSTDLYYTLRSRYLCVCFIYLHEIFFKKCSNFSQILMSDEYQCKMILRTICASFKPTILCFKSPRNGFLFANFTNTKNAILFRQKQLLPQIHPPFLVRFKSNSSKPPTKKSKTKSTIVGETKTHECTKCGQICISKSALEIHIQTVHEGRKDHKCPKCGKKYGTKSNLNAHIKVHCENLRNFNFT